MIKIEHFLLNPDTLENLLKEIVLREGTDYGEIEITTAEKISQLKAALNSGEASLMFDAVSGHCDVIKKKNNK